MVQSGGEVTLDKYIYTEKKSVCTSLGSTQRLLNFNGRVVIVDNGHLRKKTERERIWGMEFEGREKRSRSRENNSKRQDNNPA